MKPLKKEVEVKMQYEYNGNLLEEERALQVAKEIVGKYPMISIAKASAAARLEGYLSKKVTPIDKLNRLYNIMLINCNDRKIMSIVYRDYLYILALYMNEIDNNKYFTLANIIKDYLQGNCAFPFISNIT